MTSIKKALRSALGTAGIAITITQSLISAEPPAETPPTKDNNQLPQVVVTATKTETEAWKTASSVTVINREEIEREHYRMLADALRRVPGLTLADRGAPGTLATVLMRGTKSEHTAVLVDGRPVPMNLAGTFNLETTPLDNIERIEVLRGPASSLYGGKTIGGVINVITRSGRGLAKPQTTAFFEAGSYGSFREGISTLGSSGDVDWAFDFNRTDLQGQRVNSQFQQTGGAGRLGYQVSETLRLELDARHYESIVGNPGNTLSNDNDDQTRTEYFSISPRVVWDTTENWRQTLTYSFSTFRQVATGFTSPYLVNNRITVQTHFLEYMNEIKATDWWTLTAGLWLQDQGYERFNDTDGIRDIAQNGTNWAVYAQSQMEVVKGLNLIAGLRHDSYSDFEDATTWRGGVSYRVPVTETLLHANYGTAFSPPSPQDLAPALSGNALLVKPERSRGFEFGIEQPIPAAKARVSATFFQNDLEDTHQYDMISGVVQPIGEARTRGVELGADWQPCKEVTVYASYTYLDADDLSGNVRLVRRPRHSMAGGIAVTPVEDVTVSLSAVYVVDREDFDPATFAQTDLEDYLVARLSMNWRVHANVELFARIENLFGESYEEVAGFPAYDTGVYAGVKVRF
ncbi:vitamin B12 transporter [Prosthecobacter fusiformis]|uniref:Vitamin B12 transporter n=1 Tax=Prosthecobacter fusiformis TaxID=48464 RepID=A0A4R7RLC2_9BACT|nr:TonB-dependent receptor [Prosthecobacter fusiformis]TDU64556.1 vitamin B12 transporter [Prosthecobacter fusiformis]